MQQDIMFIGITALNEAIAAYYSLTVDEVHDLFAIDDKTYRAKAKTLQLENGKLKKRLEVWEIFKEKAADAGLIVDL
jgi:regulator of replication initiation timing